MIAFNLIAYFICTKDNETDFILQKIDSHPGFPNWLKSETVMAPLIKPQMFYDVCNDQIDCEVITEEMKWTFQAQENALILKKCWVGNMFIQ